VCNTAAAREMPAGVGGFISFHMAKAIFHHKKKQRLKKNLSSFLVGIFVRIFADSLFF